MTTFQAAVTALFTDPNLSEPAVWRAAAVPSDQGAAVRVIARDVDADIRLGQARLAVPAMTLRVQVTELPVARRGDLVDFRGTVWRAASDGVLDRDELAWSVDVHPQG